MNRSFTRWALLAASFVIAIAYFAFSYLPSQAELTSRQVLLDQQQQLVTHATSVPMQVTRVKRQLDVTHKFCEQWRHRLVAADRLPSQLTAIVEMAEHRGLRVIDFDPGETTAAAGIVRAPLDLTVETTFPKLVAFLSAVEKAEAITWVKQASVAAKQQGEGTITCKATFIAFGKNSEFSDDVKHAPHPIP